MIEEYIINLFTTLAYSPYEVYLSVFGLMLMSSFGLPLPEEIVLISTGFACYMGMHPNIYPPPYPGAHPLNVYTAAGICFISVISTDLVIFILGKLFGKALFERKFMQRYKPKFSKVFKWVEKYGHWACGIFRFTPGLRFPGHMSCGMMGVTYTRFLLVDGTAALISTPTLVILVAFFGKEIIQKFKAFQIDLFILLGIAVLVYASIKIYTLRRKKRALIK